MNTMELCQYEYQFQNEFAEILEEKISSLLTINNKESVRLNKNPIQFVLMKKDAQNFMLFSIHPASYVYLLIVRCEMKYEEPLKNILLEVSEEIEEEYGENHRKEIKNVFKETTTDLIVMMKNII